mgnify:CR=1 FL=1
MNGNATAARQLHIVTGAPGTGKTEVLAALGPHINVVSEPARLILAEYRAAGGRGQIEAERFVALLLERAIDQYDQAVRSATRTLFDRAIPDCAAYALHLGTDPAPSLAAAATHRYHREALLFSPWESIYTTDIERTMTFEMTVAFHHAVVAAYDECGYELTEVPQTSISERAGFIARHLSLGRAD